MKTIKEIMMETMKEYDEMNIKVIDTTSSGYTVSGEKSIKSREDLHREFSNYTLLTRSRSKAYNNLGEGVIVINNDDYIAYVNVAIKTNSPRRELTDFTSNAVINKTGICPIGITFVRLNDDNIYEMAQVDFYRFDEYNLREVLKGLENLDYEGVEGILNRVGYYRWWSNQWYIELEDSEFTRNFEEENWYEIKNHARLGNVVYSKYFSINSDYKTNTHYYGHPEVGKKCFVNAEHLNIWKYVEHNKDKKRSDRVKAPKKGTVQYRINEYNKYIQPIDFTKLNLQTHSVLVDVLHGLDKDTVVLRFISSKSRWSETPVYDKEVFRVFVEKSTLTFSEPVNGMWVSTTKTNGYDFRKYQVLPMDPEKIKGTKLEYLLDSISLLEETTGMNGERLLEILGTNLFELVLSDPALREIFIRGVISENLKSNSHMSLEGLAIEVFGETLNDIIQTNKRIKNVSKKKWFAFTKSQIKKVLEFDSWFCEHKDQIIEQNRDNSWFARKFYKNAFVALGFLLDYSEGYYYNRNNNPRLDWDKYTIEKVSSLSPSDFDDFLELAKTYILRMPSPFERSSLKLIKYMKSFERKSEILGLMSKFPNLAQIVKDSVNTAVEINQALPATSKKIPTLKSGLETAEDIREWHNDLIETMNHINFERQRYWAMKEKERYELLQERFDKQQKTWAKYLMEDYGYKIVAPSSAADLSIEGMSLHHCVKSYIEPVANGHTVILFIRESSNPDVPYFTLEVLDGKIRQVHGDRNCNVEKGSDLEKFVRAFATKNNLEYGNVDMMLAAQR